MLTKLLVFLCNISPFLRRVLWRWWYSKLARQISTEQWTFMNYGFTPADGASMDLHLEEPDEPDRLCIQLYERVVQPVDLAGKEILEVGSGRGGGARFVARYHRPMRVTGLDFSPQAVALSRERHQDVDNLEFQVGDAEALPFSDASFDVVVNVESSHCYGNLKRFFSEVHRVLRPGGSLLFADLRDNKGASELATLVNQQGWAHVEKEELTPGVVKALELDDARKRSLIEQLIPERQRPVFSEFAGLIGGKIHQGFQSGELGYVRLALRKA